MNPNSSWHRHALLALLLMASPGRAEVELDPSFGPAGPVPKVGDEYLITDDLGRYSGGGKGLFHSFSRFDIAGGETATFSASQHQPDYVIARVTGGVSSDLYGTLRSTIESADGGGADLILLNPAGITVGKGATFDVQGSLHLSTADRLRFEEGPDFDAWEQSAPPLLASTAPSTFGFLSDSPAPITVADADRLQVPPGKTLSFVGGRFHLYAQTNPKSIASESTLLQVAAVAGPVEIPVENLDTLDAQSLEPGQLGHVEIRGEIDVSGSYSTGSQAGGIVIRAGKFTLWGAGELRSTHYQDDGQALADIDIQATGEIELQSEITAWNDSDGRGPDVLLRGESITMDGGTINTWYSGTQGDKVGRVRLAADTVHLENGAQIQSLSTTPGLGSRIEIRDTRELSIDDAVIASGAATYGGGAIDLQVDERVTIGNAGLILSQAPTALAGDGGDIAVSAGSLEISDLGAIQSVTDGEGAGGSIVLEADRIAVQNGGYVQSETQHTGAGGAIDVLADHVLVSNPLGHAEETRIGTRVAPDASGRGGSLTISAELVEVLDGGQVFTVTEGESKAGDLTVFATDLLRVAGVDPRDGVLRASGLQSRALVRATGGGGLLTIETRALEVRDGAQISSATFGRGDAGELVIRASEAVLVLGGENGPAIISAGSALAEDSPPPAEIGAGGRLTMETPDLELRNGGQIKSTANGAGDAGDVVIRAGRVQIAGSDPRALNPSGVFSQAAVPAAVDTGGDGGGIEIAVTGTLELSDGGLISSATKGDGDAGLIDVNAGGAVSLTGGARVVAEATSLAAGAGSGNAGEIHVVARRLHLAEGSEISTQAANLDGAGGPIAIEATEGVFLSGGASISARSSSEGAAGTITVDAGRRLELRDQSAITTESTQTSGGQVTLHARETVSLMDAEITTSVQSEDGGGGDIEIDPELVVLGLGSRIIARAYGGPGGNIQIRAGHYLQSYDSIVDASSIFDLDGEVNVESPDTNFVADLAPLPQSVLDASSLLATPCMSRTAERGSFVVVGPGALPPPPDATLD